MKYNEKDFAAQANRKARTMWVTMTTVLTAAYAIEVFKGAKTTTYFLHTSCLHHQEH